MRKAVLCVVVFGLPGLLTACAGSDARIGTMGLSSAVTTDEQQIEEAGEFKLGEPVYLNVELVEAYEGLDIDVRWMYGEDELVRETLVTERAADQLDPLWLSSRLSTLSEWEPGDYRCEVFVPDQGSTTFEFLLNGENE